MYYHTGNNYWVGVTKSEQIADKIVRSTLQKRLRKIYMFGGICMSQFVSTSLWKVFLNWSSPADFWNLNPMNTMLIGQQWSEYRAQTIESVSDKRDFL